MKRLLVIMAALIAAPALGQVPSAFPNAPDLAPIVAQTPTFADEFDNGIRPDWDRHLSPWNTMQGRTLPANREESLYVDQAFLGTDTLATSAQFNTGGTAILMSRRLDMGTRSRVLARIAKDKVGEPYKTALTNATWMGALLKSRTSFGPYGYVEARISLDVDASAWPALWLLPKAWMWPPEIDIVEFKTENGVLKAVMGIHSRDPAFPNKGCRVPVPNGGKGFHTYGVLLTATTTTFYLDRVATCVMPTPSDLHQEFYPILNITMGGWGAKTTTVTKQPQTMLVDYIRRWGLLPRP